MIDPEPSLILTGATRGFFKHEGLIGLREISIHFRLISQMYNCSCTLACAYTGVIWTSSISTPSVLRHCAVFVFPFLFYYCEPFCVKVHWAHTHALLQRSCARTQGSIAWQKASVKQTSDSKSFELLKCVGLVWHAVEGFKHFKIFMSY